MTATANTSTITVASFNLIATIVGGGVLSVPFAFAKCGGALWGILWMVLAALCTDQSCAWLCWCGRGPASCGKKDSEVLSTYGQVGQAAFGPLFEVFISALLFVFLVFVLIAYMVLIKDIWTPVVCNLLHIQSTTTLQERDEIWGPWVLLATVVFMAPFLLQKTLHALRFNCYIGFASVSILCLALCYHALWPATTDATTITTNVLYTSSFWLAPPQSVSDVVTAFPILMLSFLCHFNVNPIQKALQDPTPERVERVIHVSMLGCGILMTTFGVAGYAYVENAATASGVQGNILLNAEEQQQQTGLDIFLLLGRIGCGITLMLAMAMMMLPCRDSLLEVLDTMWDYYCNCAGDASADAVAIDEEKQAIAGEKTPLVAVPESNNDTAVDHTHLSDNTIAHCTATFLVVLVCYTTSVMVPSVAVVWSLCGSSMAFSIAFVLPAACFLRIVQARENTTKQSNKEKTPVVSPASKALAWALLVVSVVAAIVCTTQTIEGLLPAK